MTSVQTKTRGLSHFGGILGVITGIADGCVKKK